MTIEPSTYRAGEVLFEEGSEGRSLYLIKVGRVSIRKLIDGGYIEIAQVGPNQIIGELGFFDRKPRSAAAVALTYCEIIEIPYDAMSPMFDPAPEYLKRIMTGIAIRLRDADEKIRELKERLGEKEAGTLVAEEISTNDESETAKILKQTE